MSGKMKVECKRHRWRVGANCGEILILPDAIVSQCLNLWCERCGKSFKAYSYSKHTWETMKKSGAKLLD